MERKKTLRLLLCKGCALFTTGGYLVLLLASLGDYFKSGDITNFLYISPLVMICGVVYMIKRLVVIVKI